MKLCFTVINNDTPFGVWSGFISPLLDPDLGNPLSSAPASSVYVDGDLYVLVWSTAPAFSLQPIGRWVTLTRWTGILEFSDPEPLETLVEVVADDLMGGSNSGVWGGSARAGFGYVLSYSAISGLFYVLGNHGPATGGQNRPRLKSVSTAGVVTELVELSSNLNFEYAMLAADRIYYVDRAADLLSRSLAGVGVVNHGSTSLRSPFDGGSMVRAADGAIWIADGRLVAHDRTDPVLSRVVLGGGVTTWAPVDILPDGPPPGSFHVHAFEPLGADSVYIAVPEADPDEDSLKIVPPTGPIVDVGLTEFDILAHRPGCFYFSGGRRITRMCPCGGLRFRSHWVR